MLTSKFDLYKTEWLDLVFDDRNKAYGAYNLRQTYAGTMVKAMGITFTGVAFLAGSTFLFKKHVIVDQIPKNDTTVVRLHPYAAPQVEKQKPEVIKPLKAADPIKTIQNPPPVVAPDMLAKQTVKTVDLNSAASGLQTLSGKGGDNIEVPVDEPGNGAGKAIPGPDETIHPPIGLDVMPAPVGGDAAWAKFLSKNLRFPVPAQEEGISGKVFLSFIIEKDGHLSNITVDRPAGHGFDEEALRVLKLAKAWKPGMQNGQAVRVKYSIPINFQLAD
ncbi:energy transducer TonB [Mucilaginibacter xinganensis]|nr:energy transducer TonB [Mucilaginibacter xinganensis]